MVAPSFTSPASSQFPHVAALGPHGQAAASALQDAYARLIQLGAHRDALRLLDVEEAAERRDFAALERLGLGSNPLDELTANQQQRIRRLVGRRNAAALFPLMTTWFLLGWASLVYHQQIQRHHELSAQPFLMLWQDRFGGHVIPTFAETALISFVLLLVVLRLTVHAHRVESESGHDLAEAATMVDHAMNRLALATDTSTIRPPVDAAEWIKAAQQILTETQSMIASAVQKTEELAQTNNQISKKTADALATLQEQAQEFVKDLADETAKVLVAVREDQARAVRAAGEAATNVLRQAGEANQQLIRDQMTPLFQGFRDSLDDYRADHDVYRQSAAGMQSAVTDLTSSAGALVSSAKATTEVTTKIEEQLRLIGTLQGRYVDQIEAASRVMQQTSSGIQSATKAMDDVTRTVTGNMRTDLEALARSVIGTGEQLSDVSAQLTSSSAALGTAASGLASVTPDLSSSATQAAAAARAAAASAAQASAAATSAAAAATTVAEAAEAARNAVNAIPPPSLFGRLFGR